MNYYIKLHHATTKNLSYTSVFFPAFFKIVVIGHLMAALLETTDIGCPIMAVQ